ncbi:MAG: carboxypeptidase regulatory-like domain-containing protein, partial [Acidobacteriaceae bacterium]|nr:carboxypeptidase regulatory-like domain-containing protein [Acidobacteriaceae bacterium]
MKRMDLRCGWLVAAILFGCAGMGSLEGQGNRASITGTITDPSGALVQSVEVTATNLGTHEETRAVSNNDGIYSVLNLFPGQYSLKFEKTGFQPIDIPSITLLSTQVAKFDEQLAVGST